jgi:hypothetical protein
MKIALYGTADGTGPALAMVSTTTTIVPNTTNNLDFTLNAVVSVVSVALVPDGAFTSDTPATRTINVGAVDAGGATIVLGVDALVDSSGSPVTIRLADTDTSGATSIAPSVAGSTPSVLSYNGGTPNGTTIIALATNGVNGSVTSARTAFSVGGTSGCAGGATAGLQRRTSSASCELPSHFLSSPLDCGDKECTFPYTLGVYTPQIIITVLDHSLKTAPLYPSDVYAADGVIVAFNGEYVDKSPKYALPDGSAACLTSDRGPIVLSTVPLSSGLPSFDLKLLGAGCNGDNAYTAYDGHPGYDYRAQEDTPVYPAAPGKVLPNQCIQTASRSDACNAWGLVGIDHHNGYISQYMHLSKILVNPGTEITPDMFAQHTPIGKSGHKAPVALGPHFHFEVLAHIPKFGAATGDYDPTHWAFVDPYGWTGGRGLPYSPDGDPIYSAKMGIPPMQLWK